MMYAPRLMLIGLALPAGLVTGCAPGQSQPTTPAGPSADQGSLARMAYTCEGAGRSM